MGEACGVAQQGAPSINVAKLCLPPETCVAPNVDDDDAYNLHLLSPICDGIVGRCIEYAQ